MIGGALALNLDQDGHFGEILAVPHVERLQQLQTLALRIHIDLHAGAVL